MQGTARVQARNGEGANSLDAPLGRWHGCLLPKADDSGYVARSDRFRTRLSGEATQGWMRVKTSVFDDTGFGHQGVNAKDSSTTVLPRMLGAQSASASIRVA